jgi:hypothetical protein
MEIDNKNKIYIAKYYIFYLKLSEDGRSITIDSVELPEYHKMDRLTFLLTSTTAPITAGFLRRNEFNDIVDEINYAMNIGCMTKEEALKDGELIDRNSLFNRLLKLSISNAQKGLDESRYLEICLTENSCKSRKEKIEINLKKYNDLLDSIRNFSATNNMVRIIPDTIHTNYKTMSTDVFIDNRPYIKIDINLSNCLILHRIYSPYDMPIWSISINQDGDYKTFKNRKPFNVEGLNSEEIVSQMFSLPQDFEKKASNIKDQIKNIWSEEISIENVLYDWARGCYCLRKDTEEKIFSDFIIHESESQKYAKYTSLQTLIATLTSGKIRLNSIVTMNDKTEVNYLSDAAKNYKEPIEKEGDEYMFANKRFITSFTTRIDELDMWRFYGDNARGVCMVFEKYKERLEKIKDITYIKKEKSQLDGIKKLLDNLDKEEIKFRIIIIDSNCPYLKPDDFKTEKEGRLLLEVNRPDNWYINSDSGIVTPYIERKISFNDKDMGEDYFPLKLTSIILGPEMEQMDINKYQIEYLLQKDYLWGIEISKSKITSYR